MGYRGEDASRARADSRRPTPWQASSGTRPGAAGSWDDDSRDYGQGDGYATNGYGANGYDYAPDGSYAGYEDYGQDGEYGAPGGYAATGGYSTGGYSTTGGHGTASGFGSTDGYQAAGEYGQGEPSWYADSGGYDDNGGYASGGSGPHPHSGYYSGSGYDQPSGYNQAAGYGQPDSVGSHGYPALGPGSGHYSQSGGYPALGAGSGEQHTLSGNRADAGNDWYNGQPAAASGSGFADTGVHNLDAQAIDRYGTGPRQAARDYGGYDQVSHDVGGYDQGGYGGYQDDTYHSGTLGQLAVRDPVRGFPPAPGRPALQLEASAPEGLVHTGQQERYDDSQYGDAYPGYGAMSGYDDQPGHDTLDRYPASPGYDDYHEPQAFDTRGYDTEQDYDIGGHPDLGRGYDGYQDQGDPYQERYGDAGTGPRRAGKGAKNKSGKKRSKRPLLLSVLAIAVVGSVGAAAYVFVLKPKPNPGGAAAATGALPTSSASASAATAACVKELGEYCHITLRTQDPTPLTLAELYPPAFLNETDKTSFTRIGTRLDKKCANAVFGQDLINALKADACTQVLRASYISGDNTIMGTIGVVNLATTNDAHHAGKVVGANDFIAPLSTSKGVGSKLGAGTGVVEAEFKGHYLILIWAEFTNGKAPTTLAQDAELERFESDLVAGSANIPLSQRMINGTPATPSN